MKPIENCGSQRCFHCQSFGREECKVLKQTCEGSSVCTQFEWQGSWIDREMDQVDRALKESALSLTAVGAMVFAMIALGLTSIL